MTDKCRSHVTVSPPVYQFCVSGAAFQAPPTVRPAPSRDNLRRILLDTSKKGPLSEKKSVADVEPALPRDRNQKEVEEQTNCHVM